MKISLSMFAALGVALALSAPVMAQESPEPAPAPEGRPERGEGGRGGRGGPGGRGGAGGGMMGRMAEELGLSDEQKAQLDEISNAMREQMRELFQGGRPDREAMQEVREEYERQVQEILTPEQRKKYEELREGMRGGRGGFGRGGEDGGRGGRGGRGEGGQGRGRGQSDEQLLEQVRTVLVLGSTEESTVIPAVKSVLELRRGVAKAEADGQRELLGFLKEGATEEAVAEKLAGYRKSRDDAEKALADAQKALSEGVSKEQRAKLVALGLLR